MWEEVDGWEVFDATEVGPIARGPEGLLALGRSEATGLPRAWLSSDGLSWERVPLPPTTFGGGMPTALAYGPGGWLALGWRLTLREGARPLVWLSQDGRSWEPDPDPSALLPVRAGPLQLVATPTSALLLWYSGSGRPQMRVSTDGRTWTSPLDPVPLAPDAVIASAEGRYFGATDPSLWASVDGSSWEEIPSPPESHAIPTYVLGPRGILVWGDGVHITADGRTWFTSRRPGGGRYTEFDGWQGGWIARTWPIGDEAWEAWYSADGSAWSPGLPVDRGFARQDEIRLVSVDERRVLALPGNRRRDRAWLGTLDATPATPVTWMSGPVVEDPGVDPNIVPIVRPRGVRCPSKPRTLSELLRVPGWKAAVCFGDAPIGFDAIVHDSESPTAIALGTRQGPIALTAPYDGERIPFRHFTQRHRVVGHFVDPSCGLVPAGYPTPAAALLRCQTTFFVTRAGRLR